MRDRLYAHGSSTSGVLSGTASNVGHVALDNLLVAEKKGAERSAREIIPAGSRAHMAICCSLASTASLAFKLYFSSNFSPLVT